MDDLRSLVAMSPAAPEAATSCSLELIRLSGGLFDESSSLARSACDAASGEPDAEDRSVAGEATAMDDVPVPSEPEPPRKPGRRLGLPRRWLIAAVLLGLGGLVWALRSPPRSIERQPPAEARARPSPRDLEATTTPAEPSETAALELAPTEPSETAPALELAPAIGPTREAEQDARAEQARAPTPEAVKAPAKAPSTAPAPRASVAPPASMIDAMRTAISGAPADAARPPDSKPGSPSQSRPFDRSAAMIALSAAAGRASACRATDGAGGRTRVTVTFAPSGRVSAAQVDAPFGGTSVGSCIAAAFRGASVQPFDGAAVSVGKSVVVR